MEAALGIKADYSELVAEGPDANRIIRDYAQKGYNLIFATSFGYMDDVMEIAAEYPETVFEHATGYKTADNVGIYDGRGYQGWYVAGMVAGKMTGTNKLGYIAPYPIPEVIRNMNAFALGARSVNPKAEVTPVWINAWVDPPKERDAAQALFDQRGRCRRPRKRLQRAGQTGGRTGQVRGGLQSGQQRRGAQRLVDRPHLGLGRLLHQAGEDVMNGTWTNTPVWWGITEGLLKWLHSARRFPPTYRRWFYDKQQAIVDGAFDVFEGPINDNAGTERVAGGAAMTDEEKLGFDWLVEGVNGTIPQ